MKEKKNIDRLFQEKFKDFEAHPSDRVWENIASAQAKKEDRKIIPIWWKIGGAAAVIALLFMAGTFVFNNSPANTPQTQVVSDEGTSTIQDNAIVESKEVQISQAENNDVVTTTSDNTSTAEQTVPSQVISKNLNTPVNPKATLEIGQGLVVANEESKNTTIVTPKDRVRQNNRSQKEQNVKNAIVIENKNEIKNVSGSFINPLDTKKGDDVSTENTEVTAVTSNNEPLEEKKSLIEEAKRIQETTEKEAIATTDQPLINRWDVGAVAAPVYYGDFGGSGLDPQFSDNTKTGDVNLSYGVQISYAVSPKLKVRAGVNNVDLSYNTDGIAFSPNTNARRLPGINYAQNAQALNITDGDARDSALSTAEDGLLENNINAVSNGSLQQRVGYVEIPVEAVYVVSDKRFGIEVVGGVSTLVLNNNEVLLNSEGLQTDLGSASGLNDVSFTTNLGVGLNYKMTDKVKLNVEPSLKYQLNAYDTSVGDFKPYYVGIYTGVSYRF